MEDRCILISFKRLINTFSWLLWIAIGFNNVQAQTGAVLLKIQGIKVTKGGEVLAGLFKKEKFPHEGQQYMGQKIKVNDGTTDILFENVPAGDYGVIAFQDIDKNNRLKKNLIGYPTEPVGFSNDAKIKLGPPSYEDAKVIVKAGKTLIVPIKLK